MVLRSMCLSTLGRWSSDSVLWFPFWPPLTQDPRLTLMSLASIRGAVLHRTRWLGHHPHSRTRIIGFALRYNWRLTVQLSSLSLRDATPHCRLNVYSLVIKSILVYGVELLQTPFSKFIMSSYLYFLSPHHKTICGTPYKDSHLVPDRSEEQLLFISTYRLPNRLSYKQHLSFLFSLSPV
jgi:hypothetical protein